MAKQKKDEIFKKGTRTIQQEMVPSYIGYPEDPSKNYLKIENNYTRGFVINGYPSNVSMGWLRTLYDYRGDIDIVEPIIPSNERTALDELTNKIVQYEAERLSEIEKGSVKRITELDSKLQSLYQQRARLEQNFENMFHVAVTCNLYNHNEDELNKEAQRLQSRLVGKKINIMPLFLRQEECYKQTSPFGINYINDYYRNINTGALTSFFPFYSPEVNHGNGTFIGLNKALRTPVIIDFFNRKKLSNANIFISGIPGSGKSYLVSLLTLRSTLEGIKTVLIDPEGEYQNITKLLKGTLVKLAPGSTLMMNPFDIEPEVELDINGNPTGKIYVDIKGKAAELLNLFGVMFPSLIDEATKADLAELIVYLYQSFGFTSDPESLYEEKSFFNEETGDFYHEKVRKIMPRMSDFRDLLGQREELYGNLANIYRAMALYTQGGIYDMFDCYTTIDFDNETTPVMCFDISGIEDEMLRPIAMYVCLTWSWTKFMKKDLKTKKRIVCDEAWMLLKRTMAGSDFSSLFLEKCSRRSRKYNGSLCVASQNFREFVGREEGLAILSSSAVKIFMRQDSQDLGSLGDRFYLSEGEKQFLLGASRGDALMKVGNESFVAEVTSFEFEDEIISREYLNATDEGKIA